MYVPINLNVFTAAYVGALAGMAVSGRTPSDSTSSDYASIAQTVGAFAQSFDTAWGSSVASSMILESIQEMCEGVWSGRTPTSVKGKLPSTYTLEVNAIIAVINAGVDYVTNEITIPPLSVPAWFIDMTAGDDSNSGQNALDPLLTFGALAAKLGPYPWNLNQDTSITWSGTSPNLALDPVDIHIQLSCATSIPTIHFVGVPVIQPVPVGGIGIFSAVTSKNRATQTRPTVKDGTRVWTVNDRIRVTSGPATGAIFWIQKDLGGGVARVTDSQIRSWPSNPEIPTQIAPSVGDSYVVESLPKINLGSYSCDVTSVNNGPPLTGFEDLSFQDAGFLAAIKNTGTQTTLYMLSCYLTHEEFFVYGNVSLQNCNLDGHLDVVTAAGSSGVGTCFISGGSGCGFSGAGAIRCLLKSVIIMDYDWMGDNFVLLVDGGAFAYLGAVAFFDNQISEDTAFGDGCAVGDAQGNGINGPARIELVAFEALDPLVWGNGNVGHGLSMGVGSSVNIDTAVPTPTITGVTGDVRFGSSPTDTVGVFYNAVTLVQSAAIPISWANFNAVQPGGFGGNAHQPEKNNHIVRR
jgi:hypothetical protein